jgi:hypothetical protein
VISTLKILVGQGVASAKLLEGRCAVCGQIPSDTGPPFAFCTCSEECEARALLDIA